MLRSAAPAGDEQRCRGKQRADAGRRRAHDRDQEEGRRATGEGILDVSVCVRLKRREG